MICLKLQARGTFFKQVRSVRVMPAITICKLQMRCRERAVCYLRTFKCVRVSTTSLKKARAGPSAVILVLRCCGFLVKMDMKEVQKAVILVRELEIPSYLQCSL